MYSNVQVQKRSCTARAVSGRIGARPSLRRFRWARVLGPGDGEYDSGYQRDGAGDLVVGELLAQDDEGPEGACLGLELGLGLG